MMEVIREEEEMESVRTAVEGCLRVCDGEGLSLFEMLVVWKLMLCRLLDRSNAPAAFRYQALALVREIFPSADADDSAADDEEGGSL